MNLLNIEERKKLIESIKSENTKSRKQMSLRSFETNSGRFSQYVKEHLQSQFFVDSVREMPIIASINIQKAIVNKKSTIYKKPPKRSFTNVTDEQEEILQLIYKDMAANKKLNKANKNYNYQDQTIGMIIPKKGKLVCRIFLMHQIDAIPDYDDPETAGGFIISAFDRTDYLEPYSDKAQIDTATGNKPRSLRSASSQTQSSAVADEFEFKKYTEKYIIWTEDFHFMINGLGEVLNPETGLEDNSIDITSPLASEGIMPFFEVSKEKDFEFFCRASNTLTDFNIEFNSALSDLQNTMKMNGYAVGVLKAPSELQPEGQVVGAAMILKLPTDNPEAVVDFQFVSPNANIGEISSAVDKLLNYFTTSEGMGNDVVNSSGDSVRYSSGLDRFIATVNRMEAHQDDYELFRDCESEIFKIVRAWLRVLNADSSFDSKYKTILSNDAEINVVFYQPEMIMTEGEKLDVIDKKLGLGLISTVEAIMQDRGIDSFEEAEKIKEYIDKEMLNGTSREEENIIERNESNDQSEDEN